MFVPRLVALTVKLFLMTLGLKLSASSKCFKKNIQCQIKWNTKSLLSNVDKRSVKSEHPIEMDSNSI